MSGEVRTRQSGGSRYGTQAVHTHNNHKVDCHSQSQDGVTLDGMPGCRSTRAIEVTMTSRHATHITCSRCSSSSCPRRVRRDKNSRGTRRSPRTREPWCILKLRSRKSAGLRLECPRLECRRALLLLTLTGETNQR